MLVLAKLEAECYRSERLMPTIFPMRRRSKVPTIPRLSLVTDQGRQPMSAFRKLIAVAEDWPVLTRSWRSSPSNSMGRRCTHTSQVHEPESHSCRKSLICDVKIRWRILSEIFGEMKWKMARLREFWPTSPRRSGRKRWRGIKSF